VRSLEELLHHRAGLRCARASAPIEAPFTSLPQVVWEQQAMGGRPPSSRTSVTFEKEYRRVNVRALVPQGWRSTRFGKHLRLQICTGIWAVDRATAPVIDDRPVDNVAGEHARVALDLDEQQPLAREEEKIPIS